MCPIKSQCTTGTNRRIARWEHEDALDRMSKRLAERGDVARIRRQTVEHPFGTLKAWMGATHFLTRTLPRVKTEMSLHVLAYNLKRMVNIMGHRGLKAALMGARALFFTSTRAPGKISICTTRPFAAQKLGFSHSLGQKRPVGSPRQPTEIFQHSRRISQDFTFSVTSICTV